jgi:thioesterase domain-containing protein
MMTLVRQRFHRTLPLAGLFRNPTISYLAKQLSDATDNNSSPILIEIQPHGAGTPFFCVHPIGGGVLCYWDLAKAMGSERPVFGLQSPPSSSSSPSTIEEIAFLYIKDIKRVQETGPYLLGGWSMGGLIAYEIAQQLGDGGDEVNFLALFDTYPPSKDSPVQVRSDLPVLARFGADMMRQAGKDASGMRDQFLSLSPLEQRRLVFQTLKNEDILALEEEMDELLNMFTRHATALEKYSLRPAKQPITLFSSAEAQSHILNEVWKGWAAAGLNAIEVAGNHYSMIKNPYAETLAALLNERLGTRHQKASVGM